MKSSALQGMHYDPDSSTLTVQFTNGKVWSYDHVPAEKAHALRGSASAGRYFSEKIRGLYTGREHS